jgi:DNA transposition AAA+ family ATPase
VYDRKRTVGAGPAFVKTSIAAQIEKAIFIAEATGGISLVDTNSGLGKTKTLLHHLEKNARSVYLSCAPDLDSKWPLLAELRLAVTNDDTRSLRMARRDIVRALTGTNRTLLIDEAHYLRRECLDELRCIHDQAGVPLVLFRNDTTYEGVQSSRDLTGSIEYTQFKRRISTRLHLEASAITPRDVRLVAGQMIADAVVAEAMPMLLPEARANGGFGRVVRIIQIAKMLAGKGSVTRLHIARSIETIKQLGGGDDE